MFELKTTTECELTQFTGRPQKSGRDDVPAVSFSLKISNASNTMLDLLSPTMRLTAYAPIEGQEQLPGVELTTPVLRCPDAGKCERPNDRIEAGPKAQAVGPRVE